jgi:hypothetical protein
MTANVELCRPFSRAERSWLRALEFQCTADKLLARATSPRDRHAVNAKKSGMIEICVACGLMRSLAFRKPRRAGYGYGMPLRLPRAFRCIVLAMRLDFRGS